MQEQSYFHKMTIEEKRKARYIAEGIPIRIILKAIENCPMTIGEIIRKLQLPDNSAVNKRLMRRLDAFVIAHPDLLCSRRIHVDVFRQPFVYWSPIKS